MARVRSIRAFTTKPPTPPAAEGVAAAGSHRRGLAGPAAGRALPHGQVRAQPLRVGSPLSRRREGSGRRLDREGDHRTAHATRTLPGPSHGGRPVVDPVVRGEERTLVSRPPRPISTPSSASGVGFATRFPTPTQASTGSGVSVARSASGPSVSASRRRRAAPPRPPAPANREPAGQDGLDVARTHGHRRGGRASLGEDSARSKRSWFRPRPGTRWTRCGCPRA